DYEKAGGKVTYMAFITKTVAEALKAVPVVNASVDDTDILYRKDINIGVAVALDWGLIVPVIKNADRRNLLDISKAIVDLAGRAPISSCRTSQKRSKTSIPLRLETSRSPQARRRAIRGCGGAAARAGGAAARGCGARSSPAAGASARHHARREAARGEVAPPRHA